MRLAARSTVVAISLAIAAIAPTAASARLAFEGNPPAQTQTANTSPDVRSNPDQQVTHPVVAIPPILGKTQAAEQAAIDRLKAQRLTEQVSPNARYSTAGLNGYGSGHPVSVHAPSQPAAHTGNGFDWGDAAIGAAGGLALTLLVVGGAMVLSHRRSPQGDTADVAAT